MATHSSILAWRIPWMEEPGELVHWVTKNRTLLVISWASLMAQRLKHLPGMWETWVRSLGQGKSPGEGNGTPLQYFCLENPMEGGAW